MSSLEELLGNARQLRAKIVQQDSELTIHRNLQQIQSQVRERAANVQGLDGPAEPDAQTFRFLAKQGIDAKALDPMAIDLIPGGPGGGGGGTDDVFGSEDLESFLQREEQRILVDAVERNKQMTIAEFSRSYWGKLEADWQAQKPMVVEALRFHSAPQPTGGGAVVVAAAAAETSLHAQGRSRVRSARALAYSHAIRDLWDKRVARQTDFNLMRRMAEAAQTSAGSAAVKLHSCWELLEAMVRELQKLRPSGTDPAVEAPYQQRDGPQGLPLRCALLTDAEGAIVLRAGTDATSDDATLELQRMGATFAQTAEQAGKVGLGKNLHTTAFYDKAVVLHVSCAPLVLTLLAESDANVGLMVDTVPALTAAVEPLRQATALKVHM